MPFWVTVMLPDEELITVFVGVEGPLNSRPFTYQSANFKDDVPLTHNHFLYGQIGRAIHTRECSYYEVQPREEVAQDARVNLSSMANMAKIILMLNTRLKWTEIIKDL